jgi:hypothetical protein
MGNDIGDYFSYNAVIGNFVNNRIGNYCGGHPEEGAKGNVFGVNFESNTIGIGFYENTIDYNCTDNDFGNNCIVNIIGINFTNNRIGNSFANNNIGAGFTQNYILDSFTSNTIAVNFKKNTGSSTDVNYLTATHVYGNYSCEIIQRQDQAYKLKYCNNSNVIVVVNANA